MKKLLGLFCVVALLSACSSTGSNGGLFGGSECDSRDARNFMANAEDRVFFAFDSSSLSDNAKEILGTQVNWLKNTKMLMSSFKVTATKEVPENTTWLWVNVVPAPSETI